MAPSDLITFRVVLESARSAVEQSLRRRDGIAVQRVADSSDEAQYALDQDLTILELDRGSYRLAAIRLALHRIDDGSYGVCEGCSRDIGARRLAAVPWTSYCIRCQESVDQSSDGDVVKSFPLTSAA